MKYAILLSFVAALSSCTTGGPQQARQYSRQRQQVSEKMQLEQQKRSDFFLSAGGILGITNGVRNLIRSDPTPIATRGHTSIARPEARGHTSIARPEARQPARRPSVDQPPHAPPMPDTSPQTSQRSRVISPAEATRPPQKTSKH
jgi:hypothetical protein